MLTAGTTFRGPWKWLRLRKRKRVEAEDVAVAEEEEEEGVVLPDVPRPIRWGNRSHLDADAWICGCHHINLPSRGLFVDLPAFKCGRCDAQTRVDFHFSFGNLAANGICSVGEILDQRNTNDCLLFALAKAAEMTARIFEILSDSGIFVPTMDPYSLKDTYTFSRMADGYSEDDINYIDDAAVAKMMELMQSIGVQDKKCRHTCRIGGVERVHGFFEDIVKELANGYPLVVEIIPGRNFGDLLYGEIYRCPFNNRNLPKRRRKRVTTHLVILVGAARVGDTDYFYFLNSYGETFCFRIPKTDTKVEIGGIGKIIADDICSPPYKFLRCTVT